MNRAQPHQVWSSNPMKDLFHCQEYLYQHLNRTAAHSMLSTSGYLYDRPCWSAPSEHDLSPESKSRGNVHRDPPSDAAALTEGFFAGDVMLGMGTRPGTAQGLQAANQASGLGYVSQSSIALSDLSNRYQTPPESILKISPTAQTR